MLRRGQERGWKLKGRAFVTTHFFAAMLALPRPLRKARFGSPATPAPHITFTQPPAPAHTFVWLWRGQQPPKSATTELPSSSTVIP